jgi:hypothetical protein
VFKQSAAGALKAHGFIGHFSFPHMPLHLRHREIISTAAYIPNEQMLDEKCEMRNVNYNGHPLP